MAAERAPEPERRPPGSRYSWVVGVAFLIVIIVVGINSLPNAGRGFSGPQVGQRIPVFASPSATGTRAGDANIKQSARDDSIGAGKTPACDVRGPGVVNLCQLSRRGPVVLVVAIPGVSRSEQQLDLVERVRREVPGVQFVGVVSNEKRGQVAELVRKHQWRFPVAIDPDRALFNLYRVALPPTIVFARRGGEVMRVVANRTLSEAELRAAAQRLERG